MTSECFNADLALLKAEAAYRAHLEAAAAGRAGDGRHGRKVFRAMLRALDALPARSLAPSMEDGLSTVWVWSDLHLGHENIIRYTNRPFANASAMDDALYANWATTVTPADALLFVGDVAMRKAVGEATWSRIRHGPGRVKQLVVGNHDLTGSGALRVDGFDDICSLLCAAGDPPLLFTHMPLSDVPKGWVNVHGHTHAAPVTCSPHINVSVEHIRYRPLALPRIRALAKALAQGRYPAGSSTLERIESLEN
ncbi:MAG: hypothetical protein F4149_14565 [Gammaproteobacteria bacterium]|nr:hypothetical protein [Gammaproteobacteria bacterium]MYH16387.1 hypothetical protein [Gammaproteobacteria bacterium]MYK84124.1 hypothetical protein [Gammaproteobacteria bacterium]